MASPYQQQAFQRKLIYLGCIVFLFTTTWVWRNYMIEDRAAALGVRETTRGDVELSGKVLRLSLTGLRGVATCVVWSTAIEQQKKNEWNKLEFTVQWMTRLQPHFVTPWIFQSWNLSYNVSVELDRPADKYFYIARGIELLAEGERQNRNNPDMRWTTGFYYQHKITQHDETNVLRSLFQLSCIPPNERDPSRFLVVGQDGKADVNWVEFEKFCKAHPQLIRRLHSGILRESRRDTQRQFRCATARAVIQFLADNYKVVGLYELPPQMPPNAWVKKEDRLLDEAQRFPVLPPAPGKSGRTTKLFDPDGMHSETPFNDGHDPYAVARGWFGYGMECVPPPGDLPGENTPPRDRVRERIPKGMATSIFRQYPARAASFLCERLKQEGWFDEGPWPIPDWFEDNGDKFTDGTPAEVRLENVLLLRTAWEDAYRMWRKHGEENNMLFETEAKKQNKQQLADAFRKRYALVEGAMPPSLRKEDLPEDEREQIWDEYQAYRYMRAYELHTRITNFPHHYLRANVEQRPETVKARKHFWLSDVKRINASPHEALRLMTQKDDKGKDYNAIEEWRKILLAPGNEEFRNDYLIQEETAEFQVKYFDLVNEELKLKAQKVMHHLPLAVRISQDTFPGSLIPSPFVDEKGQPILSQRAIEVTEQRRIKPRPTPQPKSAQPDETPQPPM